ncbi:RNA recognition motif domain-containing protein [Iningainema tapete]|uniref:RNA-binding protein n=1 Tax=Iningainema tapete BLCC-T55 TaxID=2748662 RepID=A0A8J7C9I4_9CYAN|nr:RNA-binding protein [Iningainema tapete]MBD2778139.1 RNA-binding protein [Iningainema tapete BLCC-T55]
MTIFVTNLASQVTEADLINLFEKHGKIRKISIDEITTVEMEGENAEAQEDSAIQALNGVELFGQILLLSRPTGPGPENPKQPEKPEKPKPKKLEEPLLLPVLPSGIILNSTNPI